MLGSRNGSDKIATGLRNSGVGLLGNRLLGFGLSFAILSAPLVSAQGDAFKLTGGVSHSERLDALPENERVGSDIDALQGGVVTPRTAPNTAPVGTAGDSAPVEPGAVSGTGTGTGQARGPVSLMSRPPHIDNTQANYKKLLRQLAQQNSMAQPNSSRLKASAQSQGIKVSIQVPFWLAGQWQRFETNEISRKELPSGKALPAVGRQAAVVTDVFGTYKDKKGRIFMLVPLMTTGCVDRGFALDYHKVRKYELLITGPKTAVIKVQASHQVVNKRTRKVEKSYQDEELNQYTLVGEGLVRTDSSVKVFDQMGNPNMLTKAVSTEKRIRRFI